MGNYIGQSDLALRMTSDELVQLSDFDGDGTADSTVIARAVSDAESLIDSYVGARTAVPLTTVPDQVKTLAVSLAIYYLHLGRRSVTEDIRKQYDADLRYLRDVAAGKATLGDTDQQAGAPHPTPKHDGQDRVWGRDQMEQW